MGTIFETHLFAPSQYPFRCFWNVSLTMTLHHVMHFCALFWFGQPIGFFVAPKWPKSAEFSFFALQPYNPFFGLRRTRLNGIITSPCPEVTLDTFGFPVGARSAARRAVFWHRLPKMVLFGAKNAVFSAPNPFFRDAIQLFCHFHDGTPKRQGFCVEPVAQWASGRPPRPIFGPKIFIFLRYIHITPIFWGCTNPTQWNHKSPISWGNFG